MKSNNHNWFAYAALAVVFLIVILLFRPLFYISIIFGGILLAVGIVYFIFNFIWKMRKAKRQHESIETILELQLALCIDQIRKNRDEIVDIQKSVDELEDNLDNKPELLENNREKSKKILAGFYKELELRKAKIDFYGTCKAKLETLSYNHNYSRELALKQKKLSELQEDHYDDIASMEALKTDLEYNKRYMETIQTLSLRMLESNSIDSAQQLQLELREITKELKRL